MPPELTDAAAEDALEQDLPADAAQEDEASTEGGEEGAQEPGGEDDAAEGQEDAEGASEEGDGALSISLGDEPEEGATEKAAPDWVRNLRKENRAQVRRIRELEAENASLRPDPAVVIGPEPNPDDYEMWEDAGKAKFRKDYSEWASRKQQVADQQKSKQQAEEQDRQRWQARIDEVNKAAASALKVEDHDEAMQAFEDTFSPLQQAIILDGPHDAKASAFLRYALAKNPTKAAELAAITNPVKFAFAISKLEANMKVTSRKAAPVPDRQIRSSVSGAAVVDNQLSRLREEARRTGEYSKVADFLRAQAAKAKAA